MGEFSQKQVIPGSSAIARPSMRVTPRAVPCLLMGYLRVQSRDKLGGSRTRRGAGRGVTSPSGGARARAGEFAGCGRRRPCP